MAVIQSAESNRALLRYVKEATWGTTPASGVTREMRITSSKLVLEKETKTSDEIRADRMVPNIAEVGASSSGDVNFELSAFTHDDFFEGALLGTWSLVMNGFQVKGAQVSVSATNQIKIAGADWRNWLAVGQYVKLGGFNNIANNGYFTIASMAFTAGDTLLTLNQSTLVVEVGSAYTKVLDARDVILASTLTTFEAGNKINGGGATAFASKTLRVGQKIYLEGLGKETATLTYNAADPVAGNIVTLEDGVSKVVFEFNTNEDAADPSRVWVALDNNPDGLRTKFTEALMKQFNKGEIRVSAKNGVAGTKETGSVLFTVVCEAGDQWTVNDGETSNTFTFVSSGGTGLNVNVGATATDSATNFAAALNAAVINVSATSSAGTTTITNDNFTAGVITEVTDVGANATTTNFSGGVAPTTVLTNHRRTGGVATETGTTITAGAYSGGSATKGGFYTISSLPDTDSIVTTETLTADTNASTLQVVIKGSHLHNPGVVADITKRSYSVETGFTDVNQYFLMAGLRVGSFDLSVSTGEIVTGSFSFMGSKTTPGLTAALGGGGYTLLATTSTEILNATSNVGSIEKNGVTLATAIKAIEMTGDNSLRKQPAVGEKFPAGIGYGRFTLEGKISAYFENLDLYNDFRNHVTVSFGFSFEDVDNNKYFFRIPAAKITSNPVAPGGIDQDVMEDMEWIAQRDPVLNTQFMIDRFSSIYPFTA